MKRFEKRNTRDHERFPGRSHPQIILNSLKSLYVLVQKTIEKRFAVVKPAPNKSCCQGLYIIVADIDRLTIQLS